MKNLSIKKGALVGLAALVLSVGAAACEGNKKIQLPCPADLSCYRIEELKIDNSKYGEADGVSIREYDSQGNLTKQIIDVDGDGKIDTVWEHKYDNKGKEIQTNWDQDGNGKIDVAFTPWGAFWSEEKLKSKQYVDLSEDYKYSPNNPSWCDKYPLSPSCP